MTNKTTINSPVNVTALKFDQNLCAYPRRIEYNGASYQFIDAGLRMVVKTGNRIARYLSISDGESNFELKSFDNGSTWTLLSIASL